MKLRAPIGLSVLKDYWWLGGILVSAILLWGNLPERVKKVEAGQATQQEEITALREWTKETQGYLKGQQELNERLAIQQHATPQAKVLVEHDTDGCWQCTSEDYQECWKQELWRRCE